MPFDATPWPARSGHANKVRAIRSRGLVRGSALLALLLGSFVLTLVAAAGQPAADRDPELVRLLHSFTMIKALFVLALTAGIAFRMSLPVRTFRTLAYAGCTAAAGIGLGLNASLVALGWGAVLLHAGLFGGLFLLLRDPQVAAWLRSRLRDRARADAFR
jgi:hypothetical protein